MMLDLSALRERMLLAAGSGWGVARSMDYVAELAEMGADPEPPMGVEAGSASHLLAMCDALLSGAEAKPKAKKVKAKKAPEPKKAKAKKAPEPELVVEVVASEPPPAEESAAPAEPPMAPQPEVMLEPVPVEPAPEKKASGKKSSKAN